MPWYEVLVNVSRLDARVRCEVDMTWILNVCYPEIDAK